MTSTKFGWPYEAKSVGLAGTFNRWIPQLMVQTTATPTTTTTTKKGGSTRELNNNKNFSIVLSLPPGTYEYKFVVDGCNWYYDIMKPNCDDLHGGRNNIIEVYEEEYVDEGQQQQTKSKEKPVTKPRDTHEQKKQHDSQLKSKDKPNNKEVVVATGGGGGSENKNIAEPKKNEKNSSKKELTLVQKRKDLEELLKQRFFYTPAFEIYGGVKGLYDYGPAGSAMLANLEKFWRDFFILEENMLQIQTASLTPEVVFKTSGHVDKFEDMMVSDVVTGECYRADHLLEDTIKVLIEAGPTEDELQEMKHALSRTDDFSREELSEQMRKYNCKSPETGNDISDPFPFNLMFSTQIGPTGKYKGYLRPETAQGMFVNFDRLLEYNNGRLPFAAAQIGPAFRNEISPRSGLIRVREFLLAEIEHFVDPQNKSHHKFSEVHSHLLPLYSRESQEELSGIHLLSIGDAVSSGIVDNETLGYFLVRVHQFLLRVGVKPDCVRFRQHLGNEMAHYASDCWDAEILTSYGWVECVGNADRACFDLSSHQKASGKALSTFVPYPDGPRDVQVTEMVVNKGELGSKYRAVAKNALKYLEEVKEKSKVVEELREKMEAQDGKLEIEGIVLTSDHISFQTVTKKISGEIVQPSVIEPSFGLGRIMYSLLEHAYYVRSDDECRGYLSLKPIIAPYKTSVLCLVSDERILALSARIVDILTRHKISNKTESVGTSIGKRYARIDEIGCPFGVTVDFTTLEDDTVTLRERDSMEQVRVGVEELGGLLTELIDDEKTWDDVKKIYPLLK